MSASKKYKPETNWNQMAFEELKATWTPERIVEDEEKLKEIFALAAYSPTMKQALDWANDHGIKFFIDRECKNVGGYYPIGSGVFAIASSYASTGGLAANIITHELRHAWQDYHGFSACAGPDSNTGDFAESFIKTALKEADAMAIGNLAQKEYYIARRNKRREANARETGTPPATLNTKLSSASNRNTFLREDFLNWFSSSGTTTAFYGDFLSKYLGQKWGVYEGSLPERNIELKGQNPKLAGININNIDDARRLGVSFSGTNNYLASLQPDILPKQILRPSLADTFWGAANDEQKKLTTELRKAALRKKIAPENRKPRHPWP